MSVLDELAAGMISFAETANRLYERIGASPEEVTLWVFSKKISAFTVEINRVTDDVMAVGKFRFSQVTDMGGSKTISAAMHRVIAFNARFLINDVENFQPDIRYKEITSLSPFPDGILRKPLSETAPKGQV